MYRPPQYVRGGGGGGDGGGGRDGGYYRPNYSHYPSQNPNFPSHGNFHYFQNPATIPQHHFQNPNMPCTLNPYPQNPIFPQPNPYLNTSTQTPCIQSPTFAHPNPSPSPHVKLERIESAAAKAHHDLVTSGESVSAWKVSQSALVALKVDSWVSLGFQLQDIPSLHRLIVTEGKVNAFIHCFVGARRITSLYDLEVTICKNEGIERFEELGLGPLSRHPLVKHYFSFPSDSNEVFKITSEDIIASLLNFTRKRRTPITIEEFLDFLAEKKSVSIKEKLGVRIQSLGLYLTYIREAKRAEKTGLSNFFEAMKNNRNRGSEERVPIQPPCMPLEKQVLDGRFDFISNRIKSFSSAWDDFGGKHIRFDSSDDGVEEDDDDDDDLSICQQSSCHDKDRGQRVSNCPYPSTTEEIARLGLKIDTWEKAYPNNGKELESGSKKSSGKKRKSEYGDYDCSYSCKSLKKKQVVDLKEDEKKLCSLTINSSKMEKFITTWKEACREHPVTEVLVRMVNFYASTSTNKQKKKIRNVFSSYPGLGLLNIAVNSIKCGMLDSLYDTFQAFGEHEFKSSGSAPSVELIEIAPSVKEISNTNERNDELANGVSVDDIIKHAAKYFEFDQLMPSKKDSFSGEQFANLKKFRNCETWLMAQFSVKEFSSLGYGNFFEFLEKHGSLLPYNLRKFLFGEFCERLCLEASMLEQQLRVFLFQVEANLKANDVITKDDISMLLKKQFPTFSFHIVGNEAEKCIVDLIKRQKDFDGISKCVLFSTTLLGKQWTGNPLVYSEKSSLEAAGMIPMPDPLFCSLTVSSKDAIECLLKAPMLSDLLSWSHWDLIYAPSLGPLLQWLLNEFHVKELLCIATVHGKLIRIDHSATVDEFLEALIQCSSFQAAVKLLSLLSLNGGTSSAPMSLLKSHAKHAIDVIIRNSIDSVEVNTSRENLLQKSPSQGQVIHDKSFTANPLSDEGTSHGRIICESLSRINKAVSVVSRFILECLGHLPSEFRSFAAEILVSGLRSFTKDAPLVILHECSQTAQRLILHDIGLSLGITEWIEDYHKFSSTASAELFMFSKTPNKNPHSERSVSNNQMMLETVTAVASLTDGNRHTFDEVDKRKNGDTMENGLCKHVCRSEVSYEATSSNSGRLDNREVQDAIHIVESIRREEFGLDPNLNSTESFLLRKQHDRLGRALHCLSQELYSQDSHLLLELVQNADDNIYPEIVDPTLVFILQDSGIVVLNNEQGFSAQNIRALCDIGNSTKKGSSAGYIGHKGIGFKSVFRVTDAPEIHSNGFHVKFDITDGQIGFVLPTAISPCDINIFRRMVSSGDDKSDSASWNTCILLPFRSKFREGVGMNSIISMFSDLHPSLLLFLHRLQCIKFKNMLNDSLVIMRRETLGNGIIKVSHGEEKMSWLVVGKKLQASIIRQDVQTTEIAMAFTLQETDNGEYKPHLCQQPVFAFLPLRNYGLKFILQGDFVLPSSREEVDGDSAWNQWLLSEFPALFVIAEQSFCSLPCFQKNPGKAVTAYMSFVPLVAEVHGFFSHLPHMIISKLRISNCMLLDGPDLEWVLPCRVLRGWNEQARMLFSDSLLQKHVGLGYLAKDVILSDSLAKALGIQDYGPKVLIEIISSICLVDDDIKSLGLDWLSSWLNALYSAMSVHSSGYLSLNGGLEYDLINGLKKIPFIPLSDGSYSSLANGPIWLPCDVVNPGFEGNRSPKDFPKLYAKLRTVNPLLSFAQTTNINGIQEPNANSIIQMLQKIGVQQLSAHDIIRSHILVALSGDTNICNEDRSLMIEYLSFVMIHFQHDCASCRSDKAEIIAELRKKPVLLTNHGYKCLVDETIHFGKEYGNPVDIDKLLENIDLKWVVVDVTYLKHPSTQSLSFALTKWRDFFQELGVTDFVQVTRVDKNVPDVLCTVSESMEGSRDLIAVASFINDWESPELVNLLSAFSLKQSREHSICLLEILDKMWDDWYSVKSRSYIISNTNEDKKAFESSFMKSIREFQWIASSMDKELHLSKDLFHDCEEVRSILGTMAPYAVPKLTSKLLLKDIGFKTQVSFDDALNALHSWRVFNTPFKASIVQMSKLYTLISDEVSKPKVKITEEFIASSFIFIPFPGTSRHDVVSGMFYSPKEVYWHDPTGCVDRIQEMIFPCSSLKTTSCSPCKTLATIYPSFHDFFVNICGVHCVPPFGSYLQILLQLSTVTLPSQAAHVVFQVFLRWADDLKSESVKSEEVSNLREKLFLLENTVLPTLQDKWVSLHPSFGTICWSDDEELKQQFKHSDGIDFLQFGELSNEEKKMLSGKVATLLLRIGVPALSEIVSREAIFYGTEDNVEKASLVNWVLSYAQRYLHKLYPDIYLNMKQLGLEKLNQLQVVVVDKLFYKHKLKGRDSTSKKRVECSCLLQGNILYATHTSDHHSMFLELSRLFFNGSAELHLANFLHMVTTMAESGSTNEQTEFFIVNSQNVPKLPDDEPVWSLPSLSGLHECETPPLGASTMNVEQNMLGSSPMNVEQSISTSRRKPGISPNWPPRDWKTAPDFHYARTNHLWTRSGLAPHAPSQRELCKFPATVAHSERYQTCQGLPVPIEINGDWSIEEGLAPAANTIVLEEPAMMSNKPCEVESVGSRINPSSEPKMELVDLVAVGGRGAGSTDLSASPERDRLCFENPDDNQSRRTGRIGEMIAFKYFSEKLGLSKVRWVNEATETGLPYDLVTGDEGEMREYVEVKSTKSASKDWFDMSTREWQFAAERGDSFSIAHVVLLGPKRATITVMKNPLRLCQQNALRLAILMSRELRDSSVPS